MGVTVERGAAVREMPAPHHIGPCTLIRPLGRGGMGEIHPRADSSRKGAGPGARPAGRGPAAQGRGSGIWCHGGPQEVAFRYSFCLSTSGNAAIIQDGPPAPVTPAPDTPARSYRPGAVNRVTAVCRRTAEIADIRLTGFSAS